MPDQTRVLLGGVVQPGAEDLGVARRPGQSLVQPPGLAVEGGDAVVRHRLALGGFVAAALLGDQVQQPRTGDAAHVAQGAQQPRHIVAVDRADVVEAEFLEQGAAHHHALHVLLPAAHELAQLGHGLERGLAAFAHRGVELAGEQSGQVVADRPHRRGDGHLVVVQDHHQVHVQCPGVVQGLEGHAAAQGAVADHRDHLAPLAARPGRQRHADGGADGGAGVADAEAVVLALAAFGEAGQPPFLAQGGHAVTPAGEDLVRVGLMADVPDDAVPGRVEAVVQRDGQLHHAEPGRQVAAGLGDTVDQEAAQFARELG